MPVQFDFTSSVINNPPFGIVMDNTRLTPEETARRIISHVVP